MRLAIPDASVLLKWVLPTIEDDRGAALALRDAATAGEIALIVPPLWLYQVGNTLSRRFPQQAEPMLDALVAFGLLERPATDSWRRQALALTVDYGVTFYDAAYHALALVEGGTFITADRRYADRTRAAGGVTPLDLWH